MGTKYYTRDADGHGWLIVSHADGSTYPPLPQYTLVEQHDFKNERVYLKVLNGRCKGKIVSLAYENARKYLVDAKGPYGPPARLRFNRKQGLLWYDINKPSEAVSCKLYQGNPPPAGVFELEIPDEVHPIGVSYYAYTKYATSWFRIGHAGDRYLHPGSVTAGCITVTSLETWTDIYNHLIAKRKGDYSVGTIDIFDR